MSIGYEPFVKAKGNGDKEFGAQVTLSQVFYLPSISVITNIEGQQLQSNYLLYVDCADLPNLSSFDRFVISGTKHPIKLKAAIVNEKGQSEVWEIRL